MGHLPAVPDSRPGSEMVDISCEAVDEPQRWAWNHRKSGASGIVSHSQEDLYFLLEYTMSKPFLMANNLP